MSRNSVQPPSLTGQELVELRRLQHIVCTRFRGRPYGEMSTRLAELLTTLITRGHTQAELGRALDLSGSAIHDKLRTYRQWQTDNRP